MPRHLSQIDSLRIGLGLIIALGLGLARTEKIWAEAFNDFPVGATVMAPSLPGSEPFDPRRVPQSGGMASRLLAGISAKIAERI